MMIGTVADSGGAAGIERMMRQDCAVHHRRKPAAAASRLRFQNLLPGNPLNIGDVAL
jgi:hypothetical protein